MMRYRAPQPFRDLGHTADVGVAVEGASAEEVLARLVLAESSLLTGSAPVVADREERLHLGPGERASIAIDVLRELLFRFATERILAAECEVVSFDPDTGAELVIAFGHYDPERHGDGVDLKAVTRHEARLEERDGRWRAAVVFDI